MRKISWLLPAALLAATLSVTAYSADESKKTPADQANTSAAADTAGMMGEHDMSGTIDKIDHKTGVVKIESKPHDLELHFPPNSIKDLKKGDKITVHMGFKKD
jgi:hypothetical protein